ncbi:hypothetical protein BC835DRAFT_1411984 [Cytidiella melzeri]|nr:hypothetical protein BC835DRAFT_1411984 [Cytidiella melzeri]
MPIKTQRSSCHSTANTSVSLENGPPDSDTGSMTQKQRRTRKAAAPKASHGTAEAITPNVKKHHLGVQSRNTSTVDLPHKRVHTENNNTSIAVTSRHGAARVLHQDIPPPAQIADSDEETKSATGNDDEPMDIDIAKDKPLNSPTDSEGLDSEDGEDDNDEAAESDGSLVIHRGAGTQQRSNMAKKLAAEDVIITSKLQKSTTAAPATTDTRRHNPKPAQTPLAPPGQGPDSMPTTDSPNQATSNAAAHTPAPEGQTQTGHLNLTNQTARVQKICKTALPMVFVKFCQEHALPGPKDSKNWFCAVLSRAAEQVDDTDIQVNLEQAQTVLMTIYTKLVNRTENWCSAMAAVAFNMVKAQYHVEDGRMSKEERKETVRTLMFYGKSYNYCFVFDTEASSPSLYHLKMRLTPLVSQTRWPDKTKPYLLPIFCDVIGPLFKAENGSYIASVKESFKTAGNQYELPVPLLALSATLVHAALDFIQRGLQRGHKNPVKCNTYHSAYKMHIGIIESMESNLDTQHTFHKLMQQLFSRIQGQELQESSQHGSVPGPSSQVLETDIDAIVLD